MLSKQLKIAICTTAPPIWFKSGSGSEQKCTYYKNLCKAPGLPNKIEILWSSTKT